MNTIKKLISACFGKNVEWRVKFFRFIDLQFVVWGFAAGIIFAAAFKMWSLALAIIVAASIFAHLAYLSFRLNNLENVYMIFLFMMNVLFFPVVFVICGGVETCIPLWLLMDLVMVFLFLDGWRMYLILAFTIIVDIIVCGINILWMEQITGRVDPLINTISSLWSIFMIGIGTGAFIKFQLDSLKREKELAQERGREIEQISDSKSLFFANMSHEIRTPINTIIGLNEMTLRENVSDEVAENSVNIQNASKILLALINDILDMSKIESGKMEIVPSQYDTAALLSDMVNIVWTRANQKGLEFRIDVSEKLPSMLSGDEVRIKQIMTNILTNAVKYTEKGSVTLTVTGEETDADHIRMVFVVEDTGIGIKKESIDDLFTVFKRFDQTKTKKIEGTGLGLSIAKQLVTMMGGEIKVDSIYGKGTSFTVIIEQEIIDHNPIGRLKDAAKKSAANRERYDRSFEAPYAKVLVVDDNEMNLMVVKKLLRDTKVQVELASSGKECLEKTLNNSYHVILMDHLMPEMDGEETLKKLRERQEGYCQNVPVIVLTANVMTNAYKLYQEKGFDGYLAKPISGAVLESTLLKFLPGELVEYRAGEENDEVSQAYSSVVQHRKKKKISICAECVCDLSKELLDRYDIKLMHYYINTQEGNFLEPEEIGSAELMEYIGKGGTAYTSYASVEEYEAFMADRLTEAESVLFITIAGGINNVGAHMAMQAARNFDNVTVFDSENLSSGMGIIVLKAAEMAEKGAELKDILKELTKIKEKISTSFIVGSVDAMYNNGQIGKGVRDFSNLLGVSPILKVKNNKMGLGGFAFGKWEQSARSYIRKRLMFHRGKIDRSLMFITYTCLSAAQLEFVLKETEKYVKFDNIHFQEASATISSNCGVGSFGIIFINK